jgi:hypothetical protein
VAELQPHRLPQTLHPPPQEDSRVRAESLGRVALDSNRLSYERKWLCTETFVWNFQSLV